MITTKVLGSQTIRNFAKKMSEAKLHRKLVKFDAENGKKIELEAVYEVGSVELELIRISFRIPCRTAHRWERLSVIMGLQGLTTISSTSVTNWIRWTSDSSASTTPGSHIRTVSLSSIEVVHNSDF